MIGESKENKDCLVRLASGEKQACKETEETKEMLETLDLQDLSDQLDHLGLPETLDHQVPLVYLVFQEFLVNRVLKDPVEILVVQVDPEMQESRDHQERMEIMVSPVHLEKRELKVSQDESDLKENVDLTDQLDLQVDQVDVVQRA